MPTRTAAILLTVLVIAFVAGSPAKALPNPPLRIADSYVYAASSLQSPVNATTTFSSMQFYGTEAGEPAHLCRTAGAHVGTHSAWLAIHVPSGSLTVDTSGSTYDTVVTVYRDGPNFAQLVPIACDDDGGTGTASLIANASIATGGRYYIQVSQYSTTPAGGALTLQISVMLTGGTPPSNDNFATARLIDPAMYSKVTTNGTERATVEAAEPKPTCVSSNELSHTVWYKYVVPARSVLAFSVRGAGQNDITGFNNSTSLAVYAGSALGSLIEYGCDTTGLGYHFVPIVESINVNAGDIFYIQVGRRHSGLSPIGPSSYTLVVQHLLTGGNIQSQTFDAPTSAWKVGNNSGDSVICESSCFFNFTGGPKEKSKLKQKYTLPAGFKTNVGDTARVSFQLETATPATVKLTAKLKITYSDGTPPTTVSLTPAVFSPSGFYSYFTLETRTQSKKVAGLQIQFSHKSPSGAVRIYSVGDEYEAVRVAGRRTNGAAQSLLPLPAPPAR